MRRYNVWVWAHSEEMVGGMHVTVSTEKLSVLRAQATIWSYGISFIVC